MTHPLVLLRELAAGKTPRLALLARVDLHSGAPLFSPSQHKQDGGRDGGRERGRDGGGRAHSTRRGNGDHHQHEQRQHEQRQHLGHHGVVADYGHPSYPHHYAPQQYMSPPHFQPSGGGLGESLFPLVLARVGDGQSAGKVTGLLLQLADPGAVLALIQGPPQMLDEAVAEAVCMLGGHAAKVGGAALRPPAASPRGAAPPPHGAAACVACAPSGQTGSGGGEASASEAAEVVEAEVSAAAAAAVEAAAAEAEASVAEATATGAAAAGGDKSEHGGDGAVAEGMKRCTIASGDKGGSHTTEIVAATHS